MVITMPTVTICQLGVSTIFKSSFNGCLSNEGTEIIAGLNPIAEALSQSVSKCHVVLS
jgi:hypothetical protein